MSPFQKPKFPPKGKGKPRPQGARRDMKPKPRREQEREVIEGPGMHGILLIDKPAGVTSHDVVTRVRKIFNTRSVGHTGTLDPQATGLLVLLLGEATKISEYLIGCDKSYEGTMRFGFISETYDSESEMLPGPGGPIPQTIGELEEATKEFKGQIEQFPPIFSAKKVKGKKLYQYAREKKLPEIKACSVRVDEFEILNLEEGVSEFGVDCGSGTYVRSLVHDLGQAIGCGAVLTELRRTDVGRYGIEQAYLLDALEGRTPEELQATLLPIREGLPFPVLHILPDAILWMRRGQTIPHSMVHAIDESFVPKAGSLVTLCDVTGQVVAIARIDPAPASPPPKTMANASPPWYHPLKQFLIDVE